MSIKIRFEDKPSLLDTQAVVSQKSKVRLKKNQFLISIPESYFDNHSLSQCIEYCLDVAKAHSISSVAFPGFNINGDTCIRNEYRILEDASRDYDIVLYLDPIHGDKKELQKLIDSLSNEELMGMLSDPEVEVYGTVHRSDIDNSNVPMTKDMHDRILKDMLFEVINNYDNGKYGCQSRLAKRIGVNKAAITAWMNGERIPGIENLCKLLLVSNRGLEFFDEVMSHYTEANVSINSYVYFARLFINKDDNDIWNYESIVEHFAYKKEKGASLNEGF